MRYEAIAYLTLALLIFAAVMILSSLGCQGGGASATPSTGPPASAIKVVNTRGPIQDKPIDPVKVPDSLTRQYKGRRIGFCSAGCPQAWDKLSDAQKDAKLAAMPGAKILPAGKVVNVTCPILRTKIDPVHVPDALTREFKGQKVGFCCTACLTAWDQLTDTEKEAKLAASLPK
jgi:hypothetical protein